jgi:hypothetical protein
MSDLKAKFEAIYKKKVEGTLTDRVRAVALDASTGIILATPVKSGRARANWNISVNRIDLTTSADTILRDIVSRVKEATANFKVADVFNLTNNLPYIRRLNDGYSKQAPASFVEKAVMVAKRRARKVRGR